MPLHQLCRDMRRCAHVIRPPVRGHGDNAVRHRQNGYGYQQVSKWRCHELAPVFARIVRNSVACARLANMEWMSGSSETLDPDMVERIAPSCGWFGYIDDGTRQASFLPFIARDLHRLL